MSVSVENVILISLVKTFDFIFQAVASLPEEMRPGPDLYGFPWELVFCAAIVGAFTVFLFLYRSYQSVSVQIEIVTVQGI